MVQNILQAKKLTTKSLRGDSKPKKGLDSSESGPFFLMLTQVGTVAYKTRSVPGEGE
jgi:hypothetical protein